MYIKFNNAFGEMELRDQITSIFDFNVAGQIATDGNYYTIHVDHITHKLYALTKAAFKAAQALGHTLEADGETAIFNGEKVRTMTPDEEYLYNVDSLPAYVDLWGNVAVDKPFVTPNTQNTEGEKFE